MLIYRNEPEGKFLEYYSEISRLATLLETAKLHDEAKDQHGNESLSIEFFTKNKYWKDADEEWKKVKKNQKKVPNEGRGMYCAHQSGHFWRHKCLFLDPFAKHEMDRIDIMIKIADKN